MIKSLLSISLLALVSSHCLAQDIITKKNGEGVKAKVTEITTTEIKYKRFDNLEGPTYTLAKSDVLLVKYENNTEEVFTGNESFVQGVSQDTQLTASVNTTETVAPATMPTNVTTVPALNTTELFNKGQQDAVLYYDGYKNAGTGVLITSLLSPLVGLVPAIVCSTTKPQDQNLGYPNYSLMQETSYKTGYTNKARRIKSGKVWRNWGIAFGVNVLLVIAMQN
ncbi:hypothetical protein WG947_06810 [Pontibacter sp. H259]|uniref:hypothetical protein n=1 Tax=Pontibacter sp. H259 TaxID=3133421 RepID=UPI0030C53A24